MGIKISVLFNEPLYTTMQIDFILLYIKEFTDICNIRKEFPNIEIVIFDSKTADGCKNIDGLCTHHHSIKSNYNYRPCDFEKGYFDNILIEESRLNPAGLLRYLKCGVDFIKLCGRDMNATAILRKYSNLLSFMNSFNSARFMHGVERMNYIRKRTSKIINLN